MDLGQKGLDMFNKQKERQSPIGQMKKAFGGEIKMSELKKTYNKSVKSSKLGSSLRETTGKVVDDVYDKGENKLSKNNYKFL